MFSAVLWLGVAVFAPSAVAVIVTARRAGQEGSPWKSRSDFLLGDGLLRDVLVHVGIVRGS